MLRQLPKILIFCFVLLNLAFAESPNFQTISLDEGLSQSGVRSIAQDKTGFLWFATSDGLNKYDGYEIQVFRNEKNNPKSISSDIISCVFTDSKGNLWVGTRDKGLNLYIAKDETFKHFQKDLENPKSIVSNEISRIYEDKRGNLWIATFDGLSRFNSETEEFYNFEISSERQNYKRIFDVYEDSENTLWVAGLFGLFIFDREADALRKFERVENEIDTFSGDELVFSKIFEDSNKNLWLGTLENGIVFWDKKADFFQHFKPKKKDKTIIPAHSVWDLNEDSKGNLLIGTWKAGLVKVNLENLSFENFRRNESDPNSLSDNTIFSILIDHSETIWLGTGLGGVCKTNPFQKKFHHIKNEIGNKNSLRNNIVWSFGETLDGRILIGTQGGGLNVLDKKTNEISAFKHNPDNPKSISGDVVTAISVSENGGIWVGNSMRGLNLLDLEKGIFEHFARIDGNENSLSNNFITNLLAEENGILWIGTSFGGLNKFDTKTNSFKHFTQTEDKNSIQSNRISTLTNSKDGSYLWIGTPVGLYKFDKKTEELELYESKPNDTKGLSSNEIMSVFEENENLVWVGTYNGLEKFDTKAKTFKHYTTQDGLPNNLIYAILPDDNGNLWLSTNKGLSRFNPKEETFRNYDVSDGLQSNEFNGNSAFKSRTGELFFGGVNGFNFFHPDSVRDNPNIPKILISSFKKFDKEVKFDEPVQELEEINLSYKDNFVSFGFTALDFTEPQKNQFAYQLEGFNEDWIFCGNERFVNFANLNPGDYIFKVKGSNNDGVWNEEGAEIRLNILPPWWQTIWFRFSIGFTLLGLVFGVYKVRVRNIEKQKEELEVLVNERTAELKKQKELAEKSKNTIEKQAQKLLEMDKIKSQFFANISHEFRTPLTLIMGPIEEMLRSDSKASSKTLKMMKGNSNRLLELINQLLDISKLESGKMELEVSKVDFGNFLKRVVSSFSSFAVQKKVQLDFKTEIENLELWVDKDKIEKVVNNLLSNAFKFTRPNGRIEVRLSTTEDFAKFEVTDTGIGIPKEKMKNIFERFVQVDNTITREFEGSGIGLALTKELVELHEGKISVKSEIGKGSVFTVLLPKKKLEFAKMREKFEEIETANLLEDVEVKFDKNELLSLTYEPKSKVEIPLVLVVEDNDEVREYICNQLMENYKLIEAVDGEDGILKAKTKIPDLVISDVMMPKVDGYKLAEELKKDEKTSHIPIIMLTAKASSESKIEGLETGIDDYLTKPFDSQELRVRVKNLIENRNRLKEKFSRQIILDSQSIVGESIDEVFLKKVFSCIENFLSDSDFDVETLGNEIGMSRSQLHRKLKALIGKSPSELIRIKRLERAKKMLEKKISNVSEIAYDVGFNNLSYFSKCFKEHFGKLPSEING